MGGGSGDAAAALRLAAARRRAAPPRGCCTSSPPRARRRRPGQLEPGPRADERRGGARRAARRPRAARAARARPVDAPRSRRRRSTPSSTGSALPRDAGELDRCAAPRSGAGAGELPPGAATTTSRPRPARSCPAIDAALDACTRPAPTTRWCRARARPCSGSSPTATAPGRPRRARRPPPAHGRGGARRPDFARPRPRVKPCRSSPSRSPSSSSRAGAGSAALEIAGGVVVAARLRRGARCSSTCPTSSRSSRTSARRSARGPTCSSACSRSSRPARSSGSSRRARRRCSSAASSPARARSRPSCWWASSGRARWRATSLLLRSAAGSAAGSCCATAALKITEDQLDSVEGFFERHGGGDDHHRALRRLGPRRWCRSSPARRGMPLRRFLPYDMLGAGLWAATFVVLGYVFWQFDARHGRAGVRVGTRHAWCAASARRARRARRAAKARAWLDEHDDSGLRGRSRAGCGPMPRPAAAAPASPRPARFAYDRLTPGQLGLELTTLLAVAGGRRLRLLAIARRDPPATARSCRATPRRSHMAAASATRRSTSAQGGHRLGVARRSSAALTLATAAWAVSRRRWRRGRRARGRPRSRRSAVHVAQGRAYDRPRPAGALVHGGGPQLSRPATRPYAVAFVACAVVLVARRRRAWPRAAAVVGVAAVVVLVALSARVLAGALPHRRARRASGSAPRSSRSAASRRSSSLTCATIRRR